MEGRTPRPPSGAKRRVRRPKAPGSFGRKTHPAAVALLLRASGATPDEGVRGSVNRQSAIFDFNMSNESQVVVRPARNVRGSVRLPGDKSISHRYAMLAGIAEGPSRIENYSTGADCASTLGCMRSLGVSWERMPGGDNVIEVQG